VIFNSLAFLVFAAVVVPLFWALRTDRWRLPVLFAANFVFYGWWDWRFTGLLLGVVALAWGWGIGIARVREQGGGAKGVMLLGCGAQLAVLGYFKYANFFAENLRAALSAAGWEPGWTTLNILLPAGVSFYIFQAISYLASIYNGSVRVERSFLRIGVYLGFFPHLVAGPIIRAHLFLPQLKSERAFDAGLFWEGCRRFTIGFLYKAVFADNIAAAINPIWGSLGERSGMEILGACFGFYGQIYFDFAGYSLMAIGAANWLGYTIPENFRFPYLATSVVDFWRCWHISLSTWLRDYVYIPLGGNRLGDGRRYVNLTATMLLGGLWHGASWNFVIWGGLHGAALAVNHLWIGASERFGWREGRALWMKIVGVAMAWVVTQGFVMLCWVPFRAESFGDTVRVMEGLWSVMVGAGGEARNFPWLLVLMPLAVDTFLVSQREKSDRWVVRSPVLGAVFWVLAVLVGILFMRVELVPFLYFQF
jgi:D-alanyl-lipoteichoic acid acyltransferase DltB (MBOAT superfamily)